MIKYTNIAKGKHVIIKKEADSIDDIDFGNEVEFDRIKYLVGTITSLGRLVDKEEYKVGMLVKCAAFVAVNFGDREYGLNADDIMCQTRAVGVEIG